MPKAGTRSVDELLGFIPPPVVRRVTETGRVCAEALQFEAVVLVADVAGFTTLTEQLAERGRIGAELLADALNDSLSALIECIVAHGGEVGSFAGDALTALWPLDSHNGADAHSRAAACAAADQAARDMLGAARAEQLDLHFGIATGAVWGATVGGQRGRWEFVLAGPAVFEATRLAARASRRSVVVSDEVATLSAHPAVFRRIVSAAHAAPPAPSELADALLAFVPPIVVERFESGQHAWLAELRRVTVAFVDLGRLDVAAPDALTRLQRRVIVAQDTVARFGGALQQIVADESGVTLVAAWGGPSTSQEGSAGRALAAAHAIGNELWALGAASAAGVATGRVFCGVRGNRTRCEWALLGDVMNVAARLMRAADNLVLCDEETAHSSTRMQFTPFRSLELRGRAKPVQAYRPIALDGDDRGERRAIVGRTTECALVHDVLANLSNGVGGLLLVEGEPGIGKSRLLIEVRRQAVDFNATILSCVADAVEESSAYVPWRVSLLQLLGTSSAIDGAELRQRAIAAANAVGREALAPALNAMLPLGIGETPEFEQLGSQGRAAALRDLVVDLLRSHSKQRPTVVLVDDAHWLDSASLALLSAVVRRVEHLLVLVTTRPVADNRPEEFRQIERAPGLQRMYLTPLSASDSLRLVCRRLGVTRLPEPVASFVLEKAEGNPFFSEQLALALIDAGHVSIQDGVCHLAPGADDLRSVHLPDTVEGVITGRIDQLPAAEQLTLKVAGVLGRSFLARELVAIHPLSLEMDELQTQLDHLVALDLLDLDPHDDGISYRFRHAITHQVAYDLLAFRQRRSLHRAAAELFERTTAEGLERVLPLLAYHWTRAGVSHRAVPYLEGAAEQALARHANREAARFMRDALALPVEEGGEHAITDARARRSKWEWYLAEALLRLGNYEESREHLRAALQLGGRPVPRTRLGLVVGAAAQVVTLLVRGGRPRVALDNVDDERIDLLRATNAHQRLAEVGFWSHDVPVMLYSTVAAVTIAERAGESKELQQAYAILGFVSGLAGLSTVYAHYRRYADAVGQRVNDLDTTAFGVLLHAVYHNFTGQFDEVHLAAASAANLYAHLGDRFRLRECIIQRGYACLHRGDFAGAHKYFDECHRDAASDGSTQGVAWSVGGLMAVELATGQPIGDERVAMLEELLDRGIDHSDRIMAHGLLARVRYDRGERAAALEHARIATTLSRRLPPAVFHALSGEAAVAELYLSLWESEGAPQWRREARRALTGLRIFATMRPFARPRACLLQGRFVWQKGRHDAARRVWQRGLASAESQHLDYEAQLLRAELSSRLSS